MYLGSSSGHAHQKTAWTSEMALKNIYNLKIRFPSEDLFITVAKDILPAKSLYFYLTSCTIFKFLNGYSRHNINFSFVSHSQGTRASVFKLILPIPRTEYGKDAFAYAGGFLFNSLPIELTRAKSVFEFKRKTKNHFLRLMINFVN